MGETNCMKVMHLADLHLGRKLGEYSFFEDQEFVLKEILKTLNTEKVEVLIIAGDIYDRVNPSAESFSLWDWFITELSYLDIVVLVISGNHDSPERLGVGSKILASKNIHIAKNYQGKIEKVELLDQWGKINFYLLPFIKPSNVKNIHEDFKESDYQSAFNYVMNQEKFDYSERNVLIAHQFFISRGQTILLSDSESLLTVGGLDEIEITEYQKFDYIALGHIHRPQQIGFEHIRYSGTPLKYSFSEVNHTKKYSFIEFKEKNKVEMYTKDIQSLREMRIIEEDLDTILKMSYSEDIIQINLMDEGEIYDLMPRIRNVFPNALMLKRKNAFGETEQNIRFAEEKINKSPEVLFEEFFFEMNAYELGEKGRKIINTILEELK